MITNSTGKTISNPDSVFSGLLASSISVLLFCSEPLSFLLSEFGFKVIMSRHYCKTFKACSSTKGNVWNLAYKGQQFLITPAHLAIHIETSKWKLSKHLEEFHDFKQFDWKVPLNYVVNPNDLKSDFAWTVIDDDSRFPKENSLEIELTNEFSAHFPISAEVYLKEPRGSAPSTFNSKMVDLYPRRNPTTTSLRKEEEEEEDGYYHHLVEATILVNNIYQDGDDMSAAGGLALSASTGKCIGMLLRMASASNGDTPIIKKPVGLPPLESSEESFNFFQRQVRSLLGLDNRMLTQSDYIVKNMATKQDLYDALALTTVNNNTSSDRRREMMKKKKEVFLTARSMVEAIEREASISIASIIGKTTYLQCR